jgi:hypothetical protein
MTSTESASLQITASRLGVSYPDLVNLIQFESGFNPQAKNPYSSARGLIQFTDSTAQELGYKGSADLVKKNPTTIDQIPIVEQYLSRYRPFSGKQSLYMAVFYPAARNWPSGQVLPDSVRAVNPGINTPGDYVNHVERNALIKKTAEEGGLLITIVAGLFLFLKWKGIL